jgi:hypothetical protein
MHPELEAFFLQAEDRYLQGMDTSALKLQVAAIGKRLETYRDLRDREVLIFQPVADQLVEAFPQEDIQIIERALKHWLSVMRYCAMAMMLNNHEYLERRLLEWLTDIVKVYQMEAIEQRLCEFLLASMRQELSAEPFALIQPFLVQAHKTLLGDTSAAAKT